MSPEYIIEICISIDIAILSIAYPILIDKISSIGDKYSSEYIPVLFNNEFPQKSIKIKVNKKEYETSILKLALFITLFSFTFIIFKFEPLFGWDNWFINNSAKLIVLILTVILIILFFIWLGKVALYNGKSKTLLNYIINEYKKKSLDNEIQIYHLKAINEFAYYFIEKQDEHLQETLLEFYYTVFANIRKNHNKSEPLIYPIDLYFLVNKLNIKVAENENKATAIEHRAVSGIWLLGADFKNITISKDTFHWLWRNIYTICDHPRLVKMFWANSSQYFDYSLQPIFPVYVSEQGNPVVINQARVDERTAERNRFLEFHYALGGLLIYRKQYETLNYLFRYSQSQPPKYVLLPETTTNIFSWFENFRNEFKHNTPIDFVYYFPELDALGNSRQVNYWICCYISILFLRHYFLYQYSNHNTFALYPNLPNDILELTSWLDSVSYFERTLNDVLSNKELIDILDFGQLVMDSTGNFTAFIRDLKDAIKNKIGQQKLNASLSEEKVDRFYSQSNALISEAFGFYEAIFINKTKEHEQSAIKLIINGEQTLISKSAFTDDDIPYFNYDTIFASSIASYKIQRLIPHTFLVARTKRYLLNKNNILLALSKIIGNNKDVVIVGVSINDQIKEILSKSDLIKSILYIPSNDYHSEDTLFVLLKKDLPAIEHSELREDDKVELELVSINEDLKLYASVIDINVKRNKKIKDKWDFEMELDNEDLKVQLTIAFQSIIYWKDDREVIQLNINSEFREQGIQNDINDVCPLLI